MCPLAKKKKKKKEGKEVTYRDKEKKGSPRLEKEGGTGLS